MPPEPTKLVRRDPPRAGLLRQIPAVLTRDVARSDAELAEMLTASVTDVRTANSWAPVPEDRRR